ncbi:MAG: BamA/TamA family outer membrane protein [Elusimicrobia bacterium]|nr:BamA/TamA family outer membrane protein [Elusimicrobiota bacterium]
MGRDAVRLTDTEKRLVCGDSSTEGWREVPLNQAEYFLAPILQKRGYHNPVFTITERTLTVDAGDKTRVRSLRVDGLPVSIDPSKLRKIRGQTLTPKQLDRTKAALLDALQNRGYACPTIELSADGTSGVVDASVIPGPLHTIETIRPAALRYVDPRVLRRYEAFQRGRPFDMRLLSLSSQRMVAEALFSSAYYDVNCDSGTLNIEQRVVEGKPRLYRLGVGFDSEGYAIGRAHWRNARLDSNASSLEGALFASYREQSGRTAIRYFVSPDSRLHLRPQASARRRDELQFESTEAEAAVLPATSWESQKARLDFAGGPAVRHVHTARGLGPADDTFLALRTLTDLTDHYFEYFAGEPRSGWRMTLSSLSRVADAYSALTVHQVSWQGEMLWNLGAYEPPLLVLGSRAWAASTFASGSELDLKRLTPDMRFFLGGDANLRGAAREELPGTGSGFLSVAYSGLELRLVDVLAYGLQPLLFVDGAMGGVTGFHLDPDVYWSPGLGMRWRFPFGSARATVARGIVWHRNTTTIPLYRPHWQFFFGLGREF